VLVEEAGVPAAHVAVGEEVAFADAEGAEVGEGGVKPGRGDVGGWVPVGFGDEVVRGGSGGCVCGCGLGDVSCCGVVRWEEDGRRMYFEFFREWLLTEEHPWVIVAFVPVPFELSHALEDAF